MPFSLEGMQVSSSLTHFFSKGYRHKKTHRRLAGRGSLDGEKGLRKRMKEEAINEKGYKVASNSDKDRTQGKSKE